MFKKIGLNFFSLIIIIFFLTLPFLVFGETQVFSYDNNPMTLVNEIASDDGPYSSDTDSDTIFNAVSLVVNIVFSLLSLVFLILTIYSGMNWMMAQGNEEKVTKSKNTLIQAIIGLVIIIGSWGIWEIIVRIWLIN
jgi:ATP-dependent Zn protease